MMTQEEKEEMYTIIQSVLKQSEEIKPSPETIRQFKSSEVRMERIERRIELANEQLAKHTESEISRDNEMRIENNRRLDSQDMVLREVQMNLQSIRTTGNETLEQVKKTNGRVTKLEEWKSNTINFANGVKAGGKGTWVGIAVIVGIIYTVFGDFIKTKIGLK